MNVFVLVLFYSANKVSLSLSLISIAYVNCWATTGKGEEGKAVSYDEWQVDNHVVLKIPVAATLLLNVSFFSPVTD